MPALSVSDVMLSAFCKLKLNFFELCQAIFSMEGTASGFTLRDVGTCL